ncbi:MAG: class I SAM-dependent methyltransferase [Candidatus Falkowbacteria bacterium]|nr:class I SAM-dependent methyltransferase [Candidatus Falkowbacteria bacterium]
MKQKVQEKILSLVKDNYNSIARDFNQTRKKPLWPALTYAASKVNNGEIILDAACGNGRLLEAFKDKKIDYLGLDNSSELIMLAKNNYPDKEFLVDDLLALDFAKNKNFDWIFCVAALHHLPGDNLRIKALKNLALKLKSQGRLVLTVWRPGKNKKFSQALRSSFWKKFFFISRLDFGDVIFNWDGQIKNQESRPRYYHAFRKNEFKNLIFRAGLRITEFIEDEHNFLVIIQK